MFEKPKAIPKILKSMVSSSTLPIKLTVGLTYRCQSRCNHCDVWQLYRCNPAHLKDEAEPEIFSKMLDDLKDDIVWLEFTGGEPFLRKDTAKIVTYAMNNTGIAAAGITSNGLAHDLILKSAFDIMAKTKKKEVVIGISIDGDPDIYENVRGLDGFERAMQTFLDLRKLKDSFRGLRPHIAYTINRFNVGSFPKFYRYISKEYGIGIEEMSFSIEHQYGYYFQNESVNRTKDIARFRKNALTDIQFIRKVRRSSKISHSNLLNRFYDYYLRHVSTYFDAPFHQIVPCKASRLSAYVNPYGQVYPCTMWNRLLGDLRERNFRDLWCSFERLSTMQAIKAEKCPNCWTPCEAQLSWLADLTFLKRERW